MVNGVVFKFKDENGNPVLINGNSINMVKIIDDSDKKFRVLCVFLKNCDSPVCVRMKDEKAAKNAIYEIYNSVDDEEDNEWLK